MKARRNELRLNVGSGLDIRKGWLNLDNHKTHGAEVIFDLLTIYKGKKLPFKDNIFDHVYCSHVLEDFSNVIPVMDELVRVCKKGGLIEIKVPYETMAWTSPYHQRAFCLNTFERYGQIENYGETKKIKITKLALYVHPNFSGIFGFLRVMVHELYLLVMNKLIRISTSFHDRTFLKYLFPDTNIQVIYRKE